MKKLVCCILIVSILLCSACAQELDFQSVLKEANALHKAQLEMVPESSIHDFTPSLPKTEIGFTEEELALLTTDPMTKKRITIQQAEQDIDILFRVFHYCYGPYEYFGGEEVFSEAKEAILADIAALGSSFKVSDLVYALQNRLSFVQDGHFTINYRTVFEPQIYHYTEEIAFEKDESGYYNQSDDGKQYLISVNGDTAVENYMKLSISPEGKFVYYIGMLCDANTRQLLNLAFEQETIQLMLQEYNPGVDYDPNVDYTDDWNAEVPVVVCRNFMQEDAYRSFAGCAGRLSQEPIAILDLRGNVGGGQNVVSSLLNNYDYNGIARNMYGKSYLYSASRAGGYITACSAFSYPSLIYSQESIYDYYMNIYQNGVNDYYLHKDDAKLRWSNAKGLLFVLMDSETVSGGEWILAALRTQKNVIFVGSNSTGCMLGAAGQTIVLPNSKITLNYGSSLLLCYDERVFQEGRGFLPDIWVGGDALERVEALIAYYQLAEN